MHVGEVGGPLSRLIALPAHGGCIRSRLFVERNLYIYL